MTAHPFDASDPSSADGPADAARAEVTSGQEYLRRDPPPPRTADDIAALIQDRDEARERMYAALGDMLRTQDRCAELRAEVGALTAERDAANKRAEVAELALQLMEHTDIEHQWAEALVKERDTVRQQFVDLRASTLDQMTANWQLEEENGALRAERDALKAREAVALSLRPAIERWQGWVYRRFNVGLSQMEQDLVDAACAFDRAMGKEGLGDA